MLERLDIPIDDCAGISFCRAACEQSSEPYQLATPENIQKTRLSNQSILDVSNRMQDVESKPLYMMMLGAELEVSVCNFTSIEKVDLLSTFALILLCGRTEPPLT